MPRTVIVSEIEEMNRFRKQKPEQNHAKSDSQEPMRQFTDESQPIPPSMRNFQLEVTEYWLVPLVIFCAILLGGIYVAVKFDVLAKFSGGADDLAPYYDATGEIVVSELMDSYLSSVGGREALEDIRSIRYKGRLVEPGAEIKFQILISQPDKGMIITSPGENYSQKLILNGDTAWQVVGTGDGERKVVPMSDADTASLAWSLRLHDTLRSLSLAGEQALDGLSAREIEFQGKPCIELTKLMPDGSEFLAILDKENLHLLKMEESAPGVDGMERVETLYGDHQKVSDVVFAFETEIIKFGETQNEAYIESVEINPGIISFLFAIPEELRR